MPHMARKPLHDIDVSDVELIQKNSIRKYLDFSDTEEDFHNDDVRVRDDDDVRHGANRFYAISSSFSSVPRQVTLMLLTKVFTIWSQLCLITASVCHRTYFCFKSLITNLWRSTKVVTQDPSEDMFTDQSVDEHDTINVTR